MPSVLVQPVLPPRPSFYSGETLMKTADTLWYQPYCKIRKAWQHSIRHLSYTAMQLNSTYLQSTGQLWSASSTGLDRCPLQQDWASQCWCPYTDRCLEHPPWHGPVLSTGHHWWIWDSSLAANTQNLAKVTACIVIIEAAQGL